jgi:hypothetical protein
MIKLNKSQMSESSRILENYFLYLEIPDDDTLKFTGNNWGNIQGNNVVLTWVISCGKKDTVLGCCLELTTIRSPHYQSHDCKSYMIKHFPKDSLFVVMSENNLKWFKKEMKQDKQYKWWLHYGYVFKIINYDPLILVHKSRTPKYPFSN